MDERAYSGREQTRRIDENRWEDLDRKRENGKTRSGKSLTEGLGGKDIEQED